MNIISGNCAGTFSGFLAHLSWMEVADNPENEINLCLHARNKTHYPGNSYSDYKWLSSSQVNNFSEILEENLLHKFFEKNDYTTGNFPSEFTYFETYPADVKDIIKKYPKSLKYDGRGGLKNQYDDLEHLTLTREAFNKHWNKFKFTNEFNQKVKEEEKIIEGKKVMCLMLRQSEHYVGVTEGYKWGGPNVLKHAIETVKSKIDEYDAILLTTQVGPFLDKFIEIFGDKCIYTERERFDSDTDWKGGRYAHTPMTDEEYEIEYQNAMLDVLLSSKTDLLIGGSSNMFLAALCMNPKVQFDVFCKANGL